MAPLVDEDEQHAPDHPRLTSRDAHFLHLQEQLASRQRQESFDNIYKHNVWGSLESRSGDGSTEAYTRNARKILAHALKVFGIRDWIDAPCGDCNWQGDVDGIGSVKYLGLDIVPELIQGNTAKFADRPNMSFQQLDFINEPFPHAPDLILCRDMIQHNDLEAGIRAYYNMETSGARYLATTWHDRGSGNEVEHNVNVPPGGMYEVNIFLHPFNFSMPEFFIREGINGTDGQGKSIGVWKLPALGMGDGKYFNFSQHAARAESEIIFVKDM